MGLNDQEKDMRRGAARRAPTILDETSVYPTPPASQISKENLASIATLQSTIVDPLSTQSSTGNTTLFAKMNLESKSESESKFASKFFKSMRSRSNAEEVSTRKQELTEPVDNLRCSY